MDEMNRKLQQFYDRINYEKPVTQEEYVRDLVKANKNRAVTVYFIYKTLQELYPEIDAVELLKKAHTKFGLYQSGCLNGAQDAADGLLWQSSRAGMAAWDQTITEVSEDYAEKRLGRCPLVEALREVGATPEEVTTFCKVIFDAGDQGIMKPHPHLKLTFPKNLAEDDVCVMCVKRVQPPQE